MATYLLVNIVFLAIVSIILRIDLRRPSKIWLLTLGALTILTAVFDSMIISFGMVAYDPTQILGIKFGTAPIEDFFYALLAVILVPTLWNRFGDSND
jgi:lycopene cyclase domain-containing protein